MRHSNQFCTSDEAECLTSKRSEGRNSSSDQLHLFEGIKSVSPTEGRNSLCMMQWQMPQ